VRGSKWCLILDHRRILFFLLTSAYSERPQAQEALMVVLNPVALISRPSSYNRASKVHSVHAAVRKHWWSAYAVKEILKSFWILGWTKQGVRCSWDLEQALKRTKIHLLHVQVAIVFAIHIKGKIYSEPCCTAPACSWRIPIIRCELHWSEPLNPVKQNLDQNSSPHSTRLSNQSLLRGWLADLRMLVNQRTLACLLPRQLDSPCTS